MGNYISDPPWVSKERIDFTVAGKKNPIYISTCARLNIVGINAILYGTHLTTKPILFLNYYFL